MNTADLALQLLALGPPGPEQGKASPAGLVIIVLLAVAVFILGWSLQKQLKKVPKSFDPAEDESEPRAEHGQGEHDQDGLAEPDQGPR